VYTDGSSFDLCPADICQDVDGAELTRSACPVDAPKNGLRVEAYTPPSTIVARWSASWPPRTSSGGVEYLIDARDGRRFYYDVNALSNFVPTRRVVGFDAYERRRLAGGRGGARRRSRRPALAAGGLTVRYGYWLPVFGGWPAQRARGGHGGELGVRAPPRAQSEAIGFDLTLVAELNLNDIKGVDAPALDAWSTAAALAAVTTRLEIMIAVRPTFQPARAVREAGGNLDHLSGGARVAERRLLVVV